MKKFLNYIGSRRFAIYLLALTTAVILIANLLPNLSLMDPGEVERLRTERPLLYSVAASAGVDQTARSPYFRLLPLFIFLSITVCTARRVRTEIRKRGSGVALPGRPAIRHRVMKRDRATVKESILSLLKDRGWKIEEPNHDEIAIAAQKGKNGFWGSVIFHVGMDLTLAGVLLSAIMGVEGILRVTEGFATPVAEAFRGGDMRNISDFPIRSIYLDSFEAEYEEGKFHVAYTAHLIGQDKKGRSKRYVTRVNDPLKMDGYTVIFGRGGYAPRFILRDADGEILEDAAANMMINMPGDVDTMSIPDEGLTIDVEMFPDYYEENGKPETRSNVPNNPVLFVEVKRWDKIIGRGFLHRGQEADLEGYSLEFRELRHWVELVITKDIGVMVILLGFMVIVAGLVARFVLNDRLIWFIIEDTEEGARVGLGGRSGYFPAMFEEELKGLAEDIRLKST